MRKPWRNPPQKQYKERDSKATSAIMRTVKSKGSKAEMSLRRELWNRGFRYRLHNKKLPGKPDIVFAKKKVVVFVDGDFWHGRALIEEGMDSFKRMFRSKNAKWWIEKIERTVNRDKKSNNELETYGWLVLRYWESEILENVKNICDKIEVQLNAI